MPRIDLEPAAAQMTALLAAITDAQLTGPTPCSETSVGDLVDHVGGLTLAFTAAARKQGTEGSAQGPTADASNLGPDWRERIPADLSALVAAWRDVEAWEGMTAAGGVELPGEIAGLVALDELVIHGWDLARATGAPFDCPDDLLEAVEEFVAPLSEPGQEAAREGLFGPVVDVSPDAPRLDRIVGLTGRDPGWAPRGPC